MHLRICLHCLRNQRFQQGRISGAKSSRHSIKFVLRRTSTYQDGISTYEKFHRKYTIMSDHVLPCTSMYYYVLLCATKVRTRTYWYVFLSIFLYQYVLVRISMYCHAKIDQKHVQVRTLDAYMAVHGGTYQYVPP